MCFVGCRVFLLLQIYLNLLIMQLMTTVSLFSTWNADKFQVRKSSNIAALQNRGRDVRPQYFCPPFLTSSRILNNFSKQTRSNKLSMNPQDYSDQSRSSKQINFLLNKAVELINRMTSKKRSDDQKGAEVEATVASREMSRIPVTLSFSATHKHPISLIDPAAALEYLSLPVDAYSVLDSNLVTRSLSSDDTLFSHNRLATYLLLQCSSKRGILVLSLRQLYAPR